MSEKLSDVVTIISGGTPKTSVKEFWDGDIDWLAVADFNSSNRYVSSASKKITELGLNNSNTKMLEKGDLIISARGTVGAIAQLTKPMAFNQSCFGLRGKKNKLDTDYLYYWLKNYVDVLLNKSQGSVFNTINLSTFDDIKIELPTIADQHNISNFLTLLDDKIQINNQINQELEAMAKTLYDYWFVQFDFPDQNGKPYKSSGGKMVYHPKLKREIPVGWGVEKLGDMAQFKNGINYEKTSSGSEKVKIINVRNISSSTIFINQTDLDNPSKMSEKPQVIVFDDPMNSNDDTTQYLIISYLQDLIINLSENRQLFILTHNIHFYLNVRYDWWRRAPSTKLTLHLKKIDGKSKIDLIENQNKDLKTSYDALWAELRWLYQQDKPNFMLNPIRRIFETFAKFNNISPDVLFESDVEAKKLFNVNSHSIDDLEAELNGKTNQDIISKVSAIFCSNNAQSHFEKYWLVSNEE